MCLALPARVLAIDTSTDIATVAIGEVKKDVSLSLVEEVEVDDFVLIHVGYALNKINQEEAVKTLQLFGEAGLMSEMES